MPEPRPRPTEATPAATVVVLRENPGELRENTGELEVLLVRRNSRGAFGGMWVFPGGQVDDADRAEAAARLQGRREATVAIPDEIDAARIAAVREAREEAGIELDVEGLELLSFWMPPPEAPRRFATWFFLGVAPDDSEVVVDDSEIREFRWLTAQAAMDARNSAAMAMAPPTYMTLWWVARHGDAASALASVAGRPVEAYETRMFPASGDMPAMAAWLGDAGFADGNMSRPGPRRRLVMSEPAWTVEVTSS